MPGVLRVTLGLVPSPALDGRWSIRWWAYNFDYDATLKTLVPDLPLPKCPPGSPGTWPECDKTLPPPPPTQCPPGTVGMPPDCRQQTDGEFKKSDVKVRIRGFY